MGSAAVIRSDMKYMWQRWNFTSWGNEFYWVYIIDIHDTYMDTIEPRYSCVWVEIIGKDSSRLILHLRFYFETYPNLYGILIHIHSWENKFNYKIINNYLIIK